MPLTIWCDACGAELNEPGGLLFSPPHLDGLCEKAHLCVECLTQVADLVITLREQNDVES